MSFTLTPSFHSDQPHFHQSDHCVAQGRSRRIYPNCYTQVVNLSGVIMRYFSFVQHTCLNFLIFKIKQIINKTRKFFSIQERRVSLDQINNLSKAEQLRFGGMRISVSSPILEARLFATTQTTCQEERVTRNVSDHGLPCRARTLRPSYCPFSSNCPQSWYPVPPSAALTPASFEIPLAQIVSPPPGQCCPCFAFSVVAKYHPNDVIVL